MRHPQTSVSGCLGAYAAYFRARVPELLITVTRGGLFFAPSRVYVNDVCASRRARGTSGFSNEKRHPRFNTRYVVKLKRH